MVGRDLPALLHWERQLCLPGCFHYSFFFAGDGWVRGCNRFVHAEKGEPSLSRVAMGLGELDRDTMMSGLNEQDETA